MFEAELVQIIRSAIPDSGVNRPDAPLSPRALGFGKIGLHVTIPTTIQYRAIAAGSNRFQTQINTNSVSPFGCLGSCQNANAKIPSTACILGKAGRPELVIGQPVTVRGGLRHTLK